MIKIAAFPKCWINDISEGKISLFKWIELAAGLDCDGLELYSEFLESHEPAYLSRVKSSIEKANYTMPMMCYSPDFTKPDKSERQKEVQKQIDMIRVTADLGGQFCRTLSGQARPEITIQQGIDWVSDCIEQCIPAAEECGIKLVMENHYKDGYWQYREFALKESVFSAIIDRIDSKAFGVQYDPSNSLVAGDDYLEVLDKVIDRVYTMHASDRHLMAGTTLEELRESDGTLGYPEHLVHGVIGQGEIDYDEIFTRLKKHCFDGWVSIEDGNNGIEEMQQSLSYLQDLKKKYFSE
jgi:sugar phosphate isomerase/epimerase